MVPLIIKYQQNGVMVPLISLTPSHVSNCLKQGFPTLFVVVFNDYRREAIVWYWWNWWASLFSLSDYIHTLNTFRLYSYIEYFQVIFLHWILSGYILTLNTFRLYSYIEYFQVIFIHWIPIWQSYSSIKNGNSWDTGNYFGHTIHSTNTNNTIKRNTTEKTKNMSNTDPTKTETREMLVVPAFRIVLYL